MLGTQVFGLIPKIIRCKLFRGVGYPRINPINVTISVTNLCNSKCKTCYIWERYRIKPELKGKELKSWEFDRVFESLGKSVVWTTLSGGEPYLRPDLVDIIVSLMDRCSPTIINIPTNGLLPKVIESKTREALEANNDSTIIINLSLDGVDVKHDEIRGVHSNFKRFLDTYDRLSGLKKEFEKLQVGIHSVVSKYNIDSLLEVYEFAKNLKPDSYITEVAEQRTELFNVDKNIIPNPENYLNFINELSHRIERDYLHSGNLISRITQAFRLTYYQVAAKELFEQRQIIPCYAGFASCQITPQGDLWPCCVLGYNQSMGNIKENDYKFREVWLSEKANQVREYIRLRNCACPLANAHYTNILCSPTSMLRVMRNMIK